MPPLPGEERLITLFADVHYYFSKPTPRPSRHRFDKSSYFYIYYNATRQTSRIEIANHPGTEFQDAFNGYLDKSRIVSTDRFPTLITLEVEAGSGSSSPSTGDADEWRLATTDPRDSKQEKVKLHTLDIYFWTREDAKLAVEFFKKLLKPSQLDLPEVASGNLNTRQQETLSPVVQNLENVAISDPAYRNGQTRNSQNQPQSQAIPLPPPPPPPVSLPSQNTAASARAARVDTQNTQRDASNFTPIAYNPAAPAAPEPRAHREKTPPPEDDHDGTGLRAAATHDSIGPDIKQPGHTYTGGAGIHEPRQGQYGSPPPPTSSYTSSPPPQPGSYRTSSTIPSFAPPPASTTPGYGSQTSSGGYGSPSPQQQHQAQRSQNLGAPSFAPPPSNAVTTYDPHRHSSAAEHYIPDAVQYPQQQHEPVETPSSEFYSTIPMEKKPLQHIQPRYPEYFPPNIAQNQEHHSHSHGHGRQSPPPPSNDPYAVHQQIYRPTEAEQHSHSHRKPSRRESASSPVSQGSTLSKLKGFGRSITKNVDGKVTGLIEKGEKNKYI